MTAASRACHRQLLAFAAQRIREKPWTQSRHHGTKSPHSKVGARSGCERVALDPAGRRRARRLPGRRLPGLARSRYRARLGDRRFDRRASMRQSSPATRARTGCRGCANSGSASPAARSGTIRRTATSYRQHAQRRQLEHDAVAGPARLLQAARHQCLDEPRRRHARPPASTTTRRCARRCSSWSTSRSSTTAGPVSRSARSMC